MLNIFFQDLILQCQKTIVDSLRCWYRAFSCVSLIKNTCWHISLWNFNVQQKLSFRFLRLKIIFSFLASLAAIVDSLNWPGTVTNSYKFVAWKSILYRPRNCHFFPGNPFYVKGNPAVYKSIHSQLFYRIAHLKFFFKIYKETPAILSF